MADWQKEELEGEEDLEVVVAMTENNDMVDPESQDLNGWQVQLDLDCTMLADPGWETLNIYVDANPDNEIGNAVTLLIDRTMTIREVRGAYEDNVILEEIQALLGE